MSTKIHCDGPTCDQIKLEEWTHTMRDKQWLALDGDGQNDFCSMDCLSAWAMRQATLNAATK